MSKNNPSISLINHASVLIKSAGVNLLSDPWYSGPSFNGGWSLLYENNESKIQELLKEITHIWISHEHPDHFSIPFFKTYKDILENNNVEILYQETKDKRVVNFLRSMKLKVKEISSFEDYYIGEDFKLRCVKSFFYDSALIIEVDNTRIFNLNDCPLRTKKDVEKFANKYGKCDVLLTQFSYASWKGGKEQNSWRESAAKEKIETIRNQARYLHAKIVIPFASFIRFSNINNSYLNDSSNTPDRVVSELQGERFNTLFLKPHEEQNLQNLKQDPSSLFFWKEKFNIESKDLISFKKIESLKKLNESYKIYRKRVFENNSYLTIYLLRKFRILGAFKEVVVKIIDYEKKIAIDLLSSELSYTEKEPHISLHSASLDFIFQNTFGFDTLLVNGCFEEVSKNGFSKATRLLAIENLNNIGLSIGPSLILKLDIVFLFLIFLYKSSSKLK